MTAEKIIAVHGVDINHLATHLDMWLNRKGFKSQVLQSQDELQSQDDVTIQARKKGVWRDALGMASAVTIRLHYADENLMVEATTTAAGVYDQMKLSQQIFKEVEYYVYIWNAQIPMDTVSQNAVPWSEEMPGEMPGEMPEPPRTYQNYQAVYRSRASAPTPHDVFISYSNPDKKIADAICNSLESSRIRCWIAPRDPPAGANYQASIIDAIDASKIMVLVFSKSSNNSPHVLTEVNRAMSKGLIIIPFRLEDIPLSKEMEYLIGTRHWLDAMSTPLENHIIKLVDDIAYLLKNAKYKKA